MSARHEQIGQRAGYQHSVGVLLQPAIAHLGEAEHRLDDADRMFNPGPHFGLGAVFRSLDLIDDSAVAVARLVKSRALGALSRITARWPR